MKVKIARAKDMWYYVPESDKDEYAGAPGVVVELTQEQIDAWQKAFDDRTAVEEEMQRAYNAYENAQEEMKNLYTKNR